MADLTRRTVLGAASVGAITLLGSEAIAQESKEQGKDYEKIKRDALAGRAPGVTPARRWNTINLPNAQAAVDFVNSNPPQGAGEFVVANRPNGTLDVFYFG